jgi:hypothetical protein
MLPLKEFVLFFTIVMTFYWWLTPYTLMVNVLQTIFNTIGGILQWNWMYYGTIVNFL